MMRTLILLSVIFLFDAHAQEEESRRIPLAVLPFENISKNPDMDWLSAGFAEQLTNGLALIPTLKVIERMQMEKILREQDFQMTDFVGQQAVKAGEILAVKKLLIGSFQVVDGRLRVHARIVDAETGEVDQNNIFQLEEDADQIFELYDALIRKIAVSFDQRITGRQLQKIGKVKAAGTKNIQAYEYYTRGLAAYYGPDKKNWKEARDWFKKAIKKDKRYADARKALANTYIKLDELDEAIDEYEKMKKLPDADAEVYYTLGLFYTIRKKTEKAREHFEAAIRMNAGYAEAYYRLGSLYYDAGHYAGAQEQVRSALQWDPDHPDYLYLNAACLMGLKKTYEALQMLEEALENGFSDKNKLMKDPVWNTVRTQEKFRNLVEEYFE